MSINIKLQYSRRLIRYGILLFLLGLITGFVIPAMQNPRMGLSSHLEAIMNGMVLMLFGIIWPKLRVSNRILKWGYFLSLYGTFANWVSTFLAALWGAGAEMMPIAGGNYHGDAWQEAIIKFGLISLSLTMVFVSGLLFWGMRGSATDSQ